MSYTLIFLIVSLVFNAVLGYTTYNLYNQQWYDNFASTIEEIYNQLKRMDRNGAMEADDEVGAFFSALREMMKELFKLGFYAEEQVEDEFPARG